MYADKTFSFTTDKLQADRIDNNGRDFYRDFDTNGPGISFLPMDNVMGTESWPLSTSYDSAIPSAVPSTSTSLRTQTALPRSRKKPETANLASPNTRNRRLSPSSTSKTKSSQKVKRQKKLTWGKIGEDPYERNLRW